MAQRRKKHLYFGVFGICALALIVDRCFLGLTASGPAPSEAADMPSGSARSRDAAIAGTPPGDSPNAALSIPDLPFPRVLPAIPQGTLLRDLFSRPRPGGSSSDELNSAAELVAPGEDHPQDRIKDFPLRHRLEGLFSDSELGIAVVDGAWVRIGDKVDGCELASIDGTRAAFRCGDRETVLQLEQPSTSDPH